MPRRAQPLTVAKIKTLTPGRYCDGGATGLYLLVRDPERKFWLFRYSASGKLREAGLGAAVGPSAVPLAKARDRARAMYEIARDGRDPLAERAAEKAARKLASVKRTVTFGQAADDYVKAHRAAWRSAKHAAQWEMTLTNYAAPLRELSVDAITTEDVLGVLRPIWALKTETAGRLRGRIATVLDAAKARGLRAGDNPAAWTGHLDRLLPARTRLSRGHHAALPIDDLPAFMVRLQAADGMAARVLEFAILTAARSGEVLGARWDEIDAAKKVWTVPAARMKAGVEHRVPLTDRALEIAEELRAVRLGDHVFPGAKRDAPLSNMALAMTLRRLKVDVTAHGFRSTFRDWSSERTAFPPDVCEMALAHTIKNRVEAAYRRLDLFEKRRELMSAWARYCASRLV